MTSTPESATRLCRRGMPCVWSEFQTRACKAPEGYKACPFDGPDPTRAPTRPMAPTEPPVTRPPARLAAALAAKLAAEGRAIAAENRVRVLERALRKCAHLAQSPNAPADPCRMILGVAVEALTDDGALVDEGEERDRG